MEETKIEYEKSSDILKEIFLYVDQTVNEIDKIKNNILNVEKSETWICLNEKMVVEKALNNIDNFSDEIENFKNSFSNILSKLENYKKVETEIVDTFIS